MQVRQFTGATEQIGIVISKACQVLVIDISGAMTEGDFNNEKIEISMVDFASGKEVTLLRKTDITTVREIVAQGGNPILQGLALIEVSDGRDLPLDANKVLRINLTDLNAAKTYTLYSIESGVSGGKAVVYEELTIAQGVTTQTISFPNGNLLALPKSQLKDVRVIYSDNSELRMTLREMEIKAIATNGIIRFAPTSAVDLSLKGSDMGSTFLVLIDLEFETKRVSQVEVNLTDNGQGYKMLKINELNKPGFDWKF